MDINKLRAIADSLQQDILELKEALNEPDIIEVKTLQNLLDALESGGDIVFDPPGLQLESASPLVVHSDTGLRGPGNITVATGAAIRVPPTARAIRLLSLIVRTAGIGDVIELGLNGDVQNTLELVPDDIVLEQVQILNHRGKRGIAVNARNVKLLGCYVDDIYDATGATRDSQAAWIGNTTGNVLIQGGYYCAASENIMVGGDKLYLPVTRKSIQILNVHLAKKMEWKNVVDIKNLLELKDGWDVLIAGCLLENCWQSKQAGEAFMFTPVLGGQVSVMVNNCDVKNVSAIANITGVDKHKLNTIRTQVKFNGGTYTTNSKEMGGRGNFALIQNGPEYVEIHGCDITVDGGEFLDIVGSLPVDLLRITNNRFNYGGLGIRIGGLNHGDNSKGLVKQLEINGNTILGAHRLFKEKYPNNVYQ